MRIRRLNEKNSTYDVAEFLVHYLKKWKIDTIENITSEDLNEIDFIIKAYDYSEYEKYSKFFELLNNLEIKWYFHVANRDMYLLCHIHEMNDDEFNLLNSTIKYNI